MKTEILNGITSALDTMTRLNPILMVFGLV